MNDQVTLADIAQASGCSLATVSLALRNKPGVSQETRKRIMDIAAELGYAVRSVEVPVQTVGLLIKSEPELRQRGGPFYAYVLAGIEEICRRHRINLLYGTMLVDVCNHALETPPLLFNDTLDGLLLVGVRLDEPLEATLSHLRTPVVLVDAYSESLKVDSVLSNNYRAACNVVEYLWQQGHRHIALVGGGPASFPSILDRYRGYQQALLDHGAAEVYVADCPLRSDAALEATRSLLSNHPEITAIFGCNDEMAIAAMQAARELGISVPQQLSVVGFDDIELAQHVVPALTTLHVDKVLMGQMAMQLLLWRLENLDATCVTTLIDAPLVERQSVAACP
ncbi:MAG: LacI family DNA-binding transcriptional regulator [Anaerolineae bacterium]|nr:LacI family DNA-binding transcriptional regulator [Anaerolineae bacterium]